MSTASRVIKNLHNRGNTVIGAGCYAAAISTKNKDTIIKIGNNINDPCLFYYEYIVEKHKNNPYVPKIESLYIDYDNEYYVAVMERLKTSISDDYDFLTCISNFVKGRIAEAVFRKIAKKHISDVCSLVDLCYSIRHYTDFFSHQNQGNLYDDSVRVLDMHSQNIMFRGNVPVITDPWCQSSIVMDYNDSMDDWVHENLGC